MSKMGSKDACVPWYLPKESREGQRMCDPWQAAVFREYVSLTFVFIYNINEFVV